jgi:hypothetical protein
MSTIAAFRQRLLKSVPLSIAAILLGAVILTPMVGNAAAFLTKQKANKLFLGNTTQLTQTQTVPNGEGRQITVLCPPGQQATGGGASSPAMFTDSGSSTALMLMLESAPVNSAGRSVGWTVEVLAQTSGGPTLDITGLAVCSK